MEYNYKNIKLYFQENGKKKETTPEWAGSKLEFYYKIKLFSCANDVSGSDVPLPRILIFIYLMRFYFAKKKKSLHTKAVFSRILLFLSPPECSIVKKITSSFWCLIQQVQRHNFFFAERAKIFVCARRYCETAIISQH